MRGLLLSLWDILYINQVKRLTQPQLIYARVPVARMCVIHALESVCAFLKVNAKHAKHASCSLFSWNEFASVLINNDVIKLIIYQFDIAALIEIIIFACFYGFAS